MIRSFGLKFDEAVPTDIAGWLRQHLKSVEIFENDHRVEVINAEGVSDEPPSVP